MHPRPSKDLLVRGANRIVVHYVLVGEVWLASGQSNMERAVPFSLDLKNVQSRALNRNLPCFTPIMPSAQVDTGFPIDNP